MRAIFLKSVVAHNHVYAAWSIHIFGLNLIIFYLYNRLFIMTWIVFKIIAFQWNIMQRYTFWKEDRYDRWASYAPIADEFTIFYVNIQ